MVLLNNIYYLNLMESCRHLLPVWQTKDSTISAREADDKPANLSLDLVLDPDLPERVCCCNSPDIATRCLHTRTFLCLPKAARYEIYRLVGFDVKYPPLSITKKRTMYLLSWTKDYLRLILCHRSLFIEVSKWYWSAVIHYRHYNLRGKIDNLILLRNIPARFIFLIQEIVMVLQDSCSSSCLNSRADCERDQFIVDYPGDVVEWHETANYFFHHIKPFSLKLSLVCDVYTTSQAADIIKPLLNKPILASCTVRLARAPNPDISTYLKSQITSLTVASPTLRQKQLRFMDLPAEIRLLVLEHTDLISPCAEVEWNPEQKYLIRLIDLRSGKSKYKSHCLYNECGSCRSDVFEGWSTCFCQHGHTVAMSPPPTSSCSCWQPPTSLFLVSHSLRRDALRVFYSRNRFVIASYRAQSHPFYREADDPRKEELQFEGMNPLGLFFRAVPKEGLAHIRALDVVFSEFGENYMHRGLKDMERFSKDISYGCYYLNLPNLRVNIFINFENVIIGVFDLPLGWQRNMDACKANSFYSFFFDRLKFRKVKNFYVHGYFDSAARSIYDDHGIAKDHNQAKKHPVSKKEMRELEQELEKIVKGEDYSPPSTEIKQQERRNSSWLHACFAEHADDGFEGCQYGIRINTEPAFYHQE
jgi:hypothetical protein